MAHPISVVFLLDVDNTLLDNDAVMLDLRAHLTRVFGEERQARYWAIFEELRAEVGYADYLGALQRYRRERPHDPHFIMLSSYLLDYSFGDRLFPKALQVIEHLDSMGRTVILSDGDVVFQPYKVMRSGLYGAVDGRVLIYIHKEEELADVEVRFPGKHYVLVDDKVRLLAAFKKIWGARLTTVFPRQGHYATDEKELAKYPPADITIEHIGELLQYDLPTLLAASITADPTRQDRAGNAK